MYEWKFAGEGEKFEISKSSCKEQIDMKVFPALSGNARIVRYEGTCRKAGEGLEGKVELQRAGRPS